MFHRKRIFSAVTLCLLVCSLGLVSCGGKSNDEPAESAKGSAGTSSSSRSGTEAADPIVPSGWKTVTSDNWTFSIPDDWVEGSMRTYHPRDAVNSMGVAHTFCVTGVIAIKETGVSDDNLTYMVGFGPLNKTPKTVCGMDGYMVEGGKRDWPCFTSHIMSLVTGRSSQLMPSIVPPRHRPRSDSMRLSSGTLSIPRNVRPTDLQLGDSLAKTLPGYGCWGRADAHAGPGRDRVYRP